MPAEKVTCCNCEMDCTRHHFMCDQDDGEWCQECWDKTACAQGVHGEGCPTQVFGEQAAPAYDDKI